MRIKLFKLIALAVVFGFGGFQMVSAETFTDFEPPGFVVGQSVDDLEPDGNTIVPPMSFGNSCREAWFIPIAGTDEEVVDLSPDPHGKVWRISTAVDSGASGQNPHSPRNSGVISGETVSLPNDSCGPSTTSNFYGQVDFRSVTGSAQAGLEFVIDANSSDTRQAFVRLVDNGVSGFDLTYVQTADGCTFPNTPIASDLSYTDWHTLGIEILFVDGLASGTAGQPGAEGNDIVNICVDGILVHTGTSWESCIGARVVDQLLFETSNENPSFAGNGLYFDNVLVTDVRPVGNCNLIVQSIGLSPAFATNVVLTDYTVTADVILGDVPQEGVLVAFEVISGPNAGEMSDPGGGECTPNDCTTDENGQVSWTYTSKFMGTDTIVASFFDEDLDMTVESNPVEATWIFPPRNVPTLSKWGLIAMAGILGIVGFMVMRRRKVTA